MHFFWRSTLVVLVVGIALTATAKAQKPSVKSEPSVDVDFDLDVQPIFTRFGCNAGACHGKQRGQNGFQLSLLAFDPDFDHDALTKESRGRRTSFTAPEQSLLLLKPVGAMPHGGGKRIEPNSAEFATLQRWVAQGDRKSVV